MPLESSVARETRLRSQYFEMRSIATNSLLPLIVALLIAGSNASLPRRGSRNQSQNRTMSAGKAFKVLVTHPEVPQEGIDLLKENCEIVQVQSVPINRAELLEKIRGVDGVLWGGHEPLNAEALDAAGPQLKSISTMSAGIDYVDVPEVKRRKIPLGHTPTVLNTAVADLAVGLLIAASRRFHEGRKTIDK